MKIFCIGRNYAMHAKELGNIIPKAPIVFMKPPTALIINDRPFHYPDFSENIHYEGEIVVRMCKNGKRIQPQFVRTYYDAVAFGIDFTARDLQLECKKSGRPWEIAKGFDGSAPVSRFISLEELGQDADSISFMLKKNGTVKQQASTSEMLFSVDRLICHLSHFFKIQHGDYLFTGTPQGVGEVRRGDLLEGFIEGQKMLTCQVR